VVHTDVDLDAQLEEWAKTRLEAKLDELAERRRQYQEAQARQAVDVEPTVARPVSPPPPPPPRRREPMPAPEREYERGVHLRLGRSRGGARRLAALRVT
jgi:hypothetical protein